MRTRLVVDVTILEMEKLAAFGAEQSFIEPHEEAGDDLVLDVVVNPKNPPVDTGYEIVEQTIVSTSENGRRIDIVVDVTDAEKLVAEAKSRYQASWAGDNPEWEPATLCEALYETLIASNANPGPIDIGFEINNASYLDDGPTVPEAAPAV